MQKSTSYPGRVLEPGLGLSTSDRQRLINKIFVVIHSAASVRFDDPPREAMNANIAGTERLLELAKSMKNLKLFVHISTVYANCARDIAEEKIYE
ncbi:fatty acyl-CoA reductase 1-like [Varroa destructor]|uniref:Fatty acyl-CoA reductase n=1 Tax=Varroa destructor TaxID=109461 RepID=A0A7M7KGG7_VARDE|nr:fatty acyl-CoA reductase 1-like [Varroa destructor]